MGNHNSYSDQKKTSMWLTARLLLQGPSKAQQTHFHWFRSTQYMAFVILHRAWPPATGILGTYAIQFRLMQRPPFNYFRVLNHGFSAPDGYTLRWKLLRCRQPCPIQSMECPWRLSGGGQAESSPSHALYIRDEKKGMILGWITFKIEHGLRKLFPSNPLSSFQIP